MNKNKERFYEIDIVKSFAVVLMVVFHYYYVYYLTGNQLIKMDNTILTMSAIISHTLFIFLFGLNLSISYNKSKQNKKENEYYSKQIKRSILYFFIGGIISLISYKLIPSKFIFFGIFHFLGLSVIVSQLFVFNEITSVIGIIIFGLLASFLNLKFKNNIINNILGLNTNFASIDYFPFIPYFIYVLLGINTGHIMYKDGKRTMDLDRFDNFVESNKLIKFLVYIGQNSLIIYIVHWILFYMIM